MAHHTCKLTDQKVLEQTRTVLATHLTLQAEGTKCTTADLIDFLVGVTAQASSLQAVGSERAAGPQPDTVRGYLNAQLALADLPARLQEVNAALASQLPARVRRQPVEVALDLHDRPYYGKLDQADGLWVRGKARAGTTRFHRVASAYVLDRHGRVTLAVRVVQAGERQAAIVGDLLDHIQTLGIAVKCLYLDRGFDSVGVQQTIRARGLKAIIACTVRGKTGGTRSLCVGPRSYRTRHNFHGDDHTRWEGELAVCRVYTTKRRTGRAARKAGWLLFILIGLDLTPRQARRAYQRRFGIESSYRCANQVRGWTTSANIAYRFLLIALSFVLTNIWVHLRWLFAQVPRRGRRRLQLAHFSLRRCARFIVQALDRQRGVVTQIVALSPPRL
jgi:DDE family transposase